MFIFNESKQAMQTLITKIYKKLINIRILPWHEYEHEHSGTYSKAIY